MNQDIDPRESYYVYDLGQGQIKGQSLVLNCASLQHAGKEIY